MKKQRSAKAELNRAIRAAEKRSRRNASRADNIIVGSLPAGAVLHFWDNNEDNDHFSNLVVCPSKEYSNLLHKRLLEVFGSYKAFVKSRARFRKSLKKEKRDERINRMLDTEALRDT